LGGEKGKKGSFLKKNHGPVLVGFRRGRAHHSLAVGRCGDGDASKLGTEARTEGPFASSYHARVLPDSFDVVDDPGLKS